MSAASKLSESVDNGLKIIKFIQENRQTIQNTYGRSSIEEPSTGERIKAWEAFAAEKIQSNTGQEGGKDGNDGPGERDGQDSETGDNNKPRNLPTSESPVSGPTTSGSNSTWDDYDSDFTDLEQWAEHARSFRQADRGGDSELERNDGNEESTGNPAGASGPVTDDGSGHQTGPDNREGIKHAKPATVVELTQDDLKGMLQETEELPNKRVKNINIIEEVSKSIPSSSSVIKKTTEGNSASTQSTERRSSEAGATQSVQGSHHIQDMSPASADTAHSSARSAKMNTQPAGMTDMPNAASDVVDTSKIDEILVNQRKILDALSTLTQVKEEIVNIKKILTNQSVAISTLDSYISDLMIIIPSSGKSNQDSNKTVNPDLRMVVGRDKIRGRGEVLKKYEDKDKILVSEDLQVIPEVDESFVTHDIDYSTNNAANFVPTDDPVSIQIIQDMIDSEVSDPAMVEDLQDLMYESYGKIPLKEVYKTIRKIIDDVDQARLGMD